jgi:hypothetical protein
MAQFNTTAGIAHTIETIIKTAKHEIILVSPYVQINRLVMQRLHDAAAKNIAIKFIYREDADNKKDELAKLTQLPTLQLYAVKNLHAKCFMNEHSLHIGSMNLYNYSEKNNREMGVTFTLHDSPEIYAQAYEEVQSILRASTLQLPPAAATTALKQPSEKLLIATTPAPAPTGGYCIRCRCTIPLHINRPYCNSCRSAVLARQSPACNGRHCHHCGKTTSTTLKAPYCPPCWRVLKKT